MVKRFLFDGVNRQGTGLAIDLAEQQSTVIATASADACLALGDVAVMCAELALNPLIFQCLIIPTLHINCQ